MTLKALVAAACLCFGTATAGLAATVTVNGEEFDIGFITGSFEDNAGLLTAQPFFGNASLASDLADAVSNGGLLGDICSCGFLDFADGFEVSIGFEVLSFFVDAAGAGGRSFGSDEEATFATATSVAPVPLPAGGLLLLSGLVGVAGLKRRKKRAA